jgi:hypothetical protein
MISAILVVFVDDRLLDKKINEIITLRVTATASDNIWEQYGVKSDNNLYFYENKTNAKYQIKELMQLKSIGLLDDSTWQELGFNDYKNDVKSEIQVDAFLEKYNEIKERYIGYLTTDKSRRIFKELGFKSLFLAKSLKKLDMEMVNGKILNKYNAVFVKRLLEMNNEDFAEYKNELLIRKNSITANISRSDNVLLKKFFELAVVIKTLNAIKTNGFTRTIKVLH